MSKEIWQIIKKDYIGDTTYFESAKNEHAGAVYSAVRKGKPVPIQVLKDYPELNKGRR